MNPLKYLLIPRSSNRHGEAKKMRQVILPFYRPDESHRGEIKDKELNEFALLFWAVSLEFYACLLEPLKKTLRSRVLV